MVNFFFSHVIQQNRVFSFSEISAANSVSLNLLHFLWTQCLQWLQNIELPKTFLLHTEHGNAGGIRTVQDSTMTLKHVFYFVIKKKVKQKIYIKWKIERSASC